jgi:hypothetical protein
MGTFDRKTLQASIAGVARAHYATVVTPLEDMYAALPVGVRTTLAATDDRVYFVPFAITRRCQLDKLGIEVTTAVASTAARLGIYSASALGAPEALLKEATSTVATTAAAAVETDIDLTVSPGVYFVAVKVDGAGVSVRGVNGDSAQPAIGDAIGDVDGAAAAGEAFYASSTVATSLASTPTLNAAREPIAPLVFIKFNDVEA